MYFLTNNKGVYMRFALDSRRRIDSNGFLHVAFCNISKECISPYYGSEIPHCNEYGLNPDKVYYGYRSAKNLEEGASSFNGLPLLREHHIEHAEKPQKEHRVGSLGTECRYASPYLQNSIIVTDAEAIRKIETGERVELSAAYAYEPVFEAGVFEGQAYDFVMTQIKGNHVALVEEGRAGPDVVVADSKFDDKSNEKTVNYSQKNNEELALPIDKKIAVVKAKLKPLKDIIFQLSTIYKALESLDELDNTEDIIIENSNYQAIESDERKDSEEEDKLDLANLNHQIKSEENIKNIIISNDQADINLSELLEDSQYLNEIPFENFQKVENKFHTKNVAKDEMFNHFREMQTAISDCSPLIGEMDIFAFDSANDIYLHACKLMNLPSDEKSASFVIKAILKHDDYKSSTSNREVTMNYKAKTFRSRFE